MSRGSNTMRIQTLLLCTRYRGFYRTSLFPSHPPSSATASSLSTRISETPTFLNPHFPLPSSSSDYCCNHRAWHLGVVPSKPSASFHSMTLRPLSTTTSQDIHENQDTPIQPVINSSMQLDNCATPQLSCRLSDETDEEIDPIDLWEEEDDDSEPQIGDGGDGGGVVLRDCLWGERALSIAQEVLLQFGDDIKLYAFKTTPRGYIYVRLDKLPNEYGCPTMEEMESYSRQYKRRLDEVGALGDLPDDLALEVSSPGAERLLRVPDDLNRFKHMPMRVSYIEDLEAECPEKNGVFFLDSVKTESDRCIWKLADVRENRDPTAKGRPLSRKKKDWRLELPYAKVKRVTLYLGY